MSLSALTSRRRVVKGTARRYLVKAPTLGTVALASALFPEHLAALRVAESAAPGTVTNPETLRGILREFATAENLEAAVEIAASVIECDGEARATLREEIILEGPELLDRIAVACLSLVDLPRMAAALSMGGDGPTDFDALAARAMVEQAGGLTPLELAAIGVAARFGQTPMSVYDWPFEAFLDACEASPILWPREGEGGPQAGASEPGAQPRSLYVGGALDALGVGYERS